MAPSPHLHPEQFYRYRSAQEEGKEVSDWLSTDAGHDWQDLHRGYNSYAHPNAQEEDNNPANGLFSIKEDVESSDRLWTFSGTASQWPEPTYSHDIARET